MFDMHHFIKKSKLNVKIIKGSRLLLVDQQQSIDFADNRGSVLRYAFAAKTVLETAFAKRRADFCVIDVVVKQFDED